MLLESKQLVIDKNTNVTYEIHHNRVEGLVTRWTGHGFDTLATTNSFCHDSLGEVISELLFDAGYDTEYAINFADFHGMYPDEIED